MSTLVVKAALWHFRDLKGRRRQLFFGATIDQLSVLPEDLEKAERLGILGNPKEDVEPADHTPVPVLSGGDELPVPPHDVVDTVDLPEPEPTPILAPIEQSAVGGAQPEIVKTEAVTEPGPIERPKTAQSVEVWREYVRVVRPDLADKVDEMTKDELKAAVPKDE